MSKTWKLVLDEEALGFLLACRIAERRKLFTALESLKKNPYHPAISLSAMTSDVPSM